MEDAGKRMNLTNVKLPALAIREWDGPFTSELVLEPGRFGIGQVPSKTQPVGFAKAICGFCSTGRHPNFHRCETCHRSQQNHDHRQQNRDHRLI